MPNMSWVLGRGGTILYKAMWTSAARIGDFLERRRTQPSGLAYASFQTEQLELRRRDAGAFQRGLERNGPRAVSEFAARSRSGPSGHVRAALARRQLRIVRGDYCI
jgi:hypothetical protein